MLILARQPVGRIDEVHRHPGHDGGVAVSQEGEVVESQGQLLGGGEDGHREGAGPGSGGEGGLTSGVTKTTLITLAAHPVSPRRSECPESPVWEQREVGKQNWKSDLV